MYEIGMCDQTVPFKYFWNTSLLSFSKMRRTVTTMLIIVSHKGDFVIASRHYLVHRRRKGADRVKSLFITLSSYRCLIHLTRTPQPPSANKNIEFFHVDMILPVGSLLTYSALYKIGRGDAAVGLPNWERMSVTISLHCLSSRPCLSSLHFAQRWIAFGTTDLFSFDILARLSVGVFCAHIPRLAPRGRAGACCRDPDLRDCLRYNTMWHLVENFDQKRAFAWSDVVGQNAVAEKLVDLLTVPRLPEPQPVKDTELDSLREKQ